jgi:hypothetical protein|tara:strand:- start:112 stop:351 length:240 start_codon:yes stop_codon:yes gene_type:complete
MKAAKVIATCFAKRSFRLNIYLIGDPVGYFGQSQIFETLNDIIDLIKFNIFIEKKYKTGIKRRDLIIINNDIGFKKGND